MTEFEQVLQDCLWEVEEGISSVDECLGRHPEHAQQLEPILSASAYLSQGREARISDEFKSRIRTRLIAHMDAHPRRPARIAFPFMRLAIGLTVLFVTFLVAGTAYAQRALPGDAFYSWKLASENAWRAISPDPTATDLAIAERRADELIAVRDNPSLYSQVLNAYLEVAARLRAEINTENEALILGTLDSQLEALNQNDILVPQLEPTQPVQEVVPLLPEPTRTSTSTPTALPVLQTPRIESTDVPEIVPTVDLPDIIPTVQDPPKIVPTIEIPPPIQ